MFPVPEDGCPSSPLGAFPVPRGLSPGVLLLMHVHRSGSDAPQKIPEENHHHIFKEPSQNLLNQV